MRKEIAFFVVASLVVCAPRAAAQALHKCIGRDGQASYQSQPCDRGSRTVWVRDAAPERPPSVERQRSMRREKARRDVESAYLAKLAGRRRGSASGHAISTSRDAKRCEAARGRRERTLERVGLERDFDLLRRLDDEVARACR